MIIFRCYWLSYRVLTSYILNTFGCKRSGIILSSPNLKRHLHFCFSEYYWRNFILVLFHYLQITNTLEIRKSDPIKRIVESTGNAPKTKLPTNTLLIYSKTRKQFRIGSAVDGSSSWLNYNRKMFGITRCENSVIALSRTYLEFWYLRITIHRGGSDTVGLLFQIKGVGGLNLPLWSAFTNLIPLKFYPPRSLPMRLLVMGTPTVGAVIILRSIATIPQPSDIVGRLTNSEHAPSLHSYRLPKLRLCRPPSLFDPLTFSHR